MIRLVKEGTCGRHRKLGVRYPSSIVANIELSIHMDGTAGDIPEFAKDYFESRLHNQMWPVWGAEIISGCYSCRNPEYGFFVTTSDTASRNEHTASVYYDKQFFSISPRFYEIVANQLITNFVSKNPAYLEYFMEFVYHVRRLIDTKFVRLDCQLMPTENAIKAYNNQRSNFDILQHHNKRRPFGKRFSKDIMSIISNYLTKVVGIHEVVDIKTADIYTYDNWLNYNHDGQSCRDVTSALSMHGPDADKLCENVNTQSGSMEPQGTRRHSVGFVRYFNAYEKMVLKLHELRMLPLRRYNVYSLTWAFQIESFRPRKHVVTMYYFSAIFRMLLYQHCLDYGLIHITDSRVPLPPFGCGDEKILIAEAILESML